jgi:hypothetical protein
MLEGCGITQQHLTAFGLHSRPVQQLVQMLRMGRKGGACQFLGSICCASAKLNFSLVMYLRCARDALVMRRDIIVAHQPFRYLGSQY